MSGKNNKCWKTFNCICTILIKIILQEDLLIHGDSVYDIIDRQDHQTVQVELNRGGNGETENVPKNRHFFCRMNVSRNARRQMRFGDQKVSNFFFSRCLVAFNLYNPFLEIPT